MTGQNDLDKSFENEYRDPTNWSGSSYVASRLKGGGELGKIIIASPKLCGHINRICVHCAGLWEWDYHLLWDRTAAGRALAERLGIELH